VTTQVGISATLTIEYSHVSSGVLGAICVQRGLKLATSEKQPGHRDIERQPGASLILDLSAFCAFFRVRTWFVGQWPYPV
jgi:hypothetical protein